MLLTMSLVWHSNHHAVMLPLKTPNKIINQLDKQANTCSRQSDTTKYFTSVCGLWGENSGAVLKCCKNFLSVIFEKLPEEPLQLTEMSAVSQSSAHCDVCHFTTRVFAWG